MVMTPSIKDRLLDIGKIAGAVTAILVLLGLLWAGVPGEYHLVFAQDLNKVDRAGAEVATELYTTKQNSLTLLKGQIEQQPDSLFKEQQKAIVDQQIHETQQKLDSAEKRQIELGK